MGMSAARVGDKEESERACKVVRPFLPSAPSRKVETFPFGRGKNANLYIPSKVDVPVLATAEFSRGSYVSIQASQKHKNKMILATDL